MQTAVRAYLPAAELGPVVTAAADALLETWPDGPGQAQLERAQLKQPLLKQPLLEQALRDCAAALRAADNGTLWQPEAHPLLFRAWPVA